MKDNRIIKWCISSDTKTFFSAFFVCLTFCEITLAIISNGFSNEIAKILGWLSLIILLLCVIAGLSALLIFSATNEETQCDDDDILINDLIVSLKKELEKKKYTEVIAIGHILNKPLFTIGKYKLRLEIGQTVKQAASAQYALLESNNAAEDKLNKYREIEMIELIDSIGWMKVELGEVDNGKADITKGQQIADNLNTDKGKFYSAKAFRHLGAIERRNKEWAKAIDFNDKSIEKANEILDNQLKTEAIAAAYYARAFVLKGQNNYTEAISFLDQSITEFNKLTDGDKKIGKVCMVNEAKARFLFYSKQNENDYHTISTATDLFEKTLSVAENNSLRLEMIRCYIGLAEINLHFSNNDKKKAKEYIEKAKNVKINCDDDEKRIKEIENKVQ